MKVLVYTRPRIDVFFKALSDAVPAFSEIIYFSDHPNTEQYDLMNFYYKAKKDILVSESQYKSIWSDEDFLDIYSRCRYLRTLTKSEADLRIKSMFLAVHRMVEIEDPDYIFGMVMDSYVLDICDRIMRKRGSQYIGFLNNMLNGFSRLTSRGELIKNIGPSKDLILKKVNELKETRYIPSMQNDFMWNTSIYSMFFTKYLKEKVKITYYFLKKIIDRDPDNFYSNTVASRHCMSCRSISQLFFRKYQEEDYLDIIGKARKLKKNIVYLPLQFYPECSIDYWGTSRELSDFYSVINKLLERDYTDTIFLVKEHPSAYGLRKTKFYEALQSNESFCLVPFDLQSNEVIELSDVVLTWTGSVGIEAVIRRKPLITFGEAYYKFDDVFYELSSLKNLESIESIVSKSILNDDGKDLSFQLIQNLLSGLVEGYVFPLDYGSTSNPINNDNMDMLAKSISNLVLRIKEEGNIPVRYGTMF